MGLLCLSKVLWEDNNDLTQTTTCSYCILAKNIFEREITRTEHTSPFRLKMLNSIEKTK